MMGQREAANLSQHSRRKFSESQCERHRGSVRTSESVPNPFTESVRKLRRTRSEEEATPKPRGLGVLYLNGIAGGLSRTRWVSGLRQTRGVPAFFAVGKRRGFGCALLRLRNERQGMLG